jgi:hypothetical protein
LIHDLSRPAGLEPTGRPEGIMLTYLHLDVFTDQLFAGNQLAV